MNLRKRELFKLLYEEYIDRVYRVKEDEIVKFMDKNYKQFKAYSNYDEFYLCKRGKDEFFIADSKESLDFIIKQEREESFDGSCDIEVLRGYK